jgi:hypothetical protein
VAVVDLMEISHDMHGMLDITDFGITEVLEASSNLRIVSPRSPLRRAEVDRLRLQQFHQTIIWSPQYLLDEVKFCLRLRRNVRKERRE